MMLLSTAWAAGQTIELYMNQPPPLQVDAGRDITISYLQGCRLGGNPTASFGYGQYIYLWSPAELFSDPTQPNPIVYPTHTTTFLVAVTDGNTCIASDEITVTVLSSGIRPESFTRHFNLFPNPTSGEITLEISDYSGKLFCQILDALGRIIRFNSFIIEQNRRETFDLSYLPKGLYFFRFISGSQAGIKSFIIE